MSERRRQLLKEAFSGEARAYFRLLRFAEKAEEEGYEQIARLFRAVAEAEKVHARNHSALLEQVGSTQENLEAAFQTETFANQVAYPRLLKEAWALEDKAAIWFLTTARNAEERHASLYKQALNNLVADRVSTYYMCRHCGWIEESSPPETCPNCGKPKSFFETVE
jgi:rubrerythrin